MNRNKTLTLLLACAAFGCFSGGQANAGTLTGSVVTPTPATTVNMTAQGTLDWIEFGFGGNPYAFNDKAPGGGPIAAFTQIGDLSESPNYYNPTFVPMSWDNGTPVPGATNNQDGVYIGYQGGNGFQLTVAADTKTNFLVVYTGCYAEQLHFNATLSDGSAPAYNDYSVSDPNESGVTGVYTLEFAANSSGQTLTLTMTAGTNVYDTGYANTTLQGAALFGQAPAFGGIQPASQINWLGANAQLVAQASGDPNLALSYQWWVEGAGGVYAKLNDAGQISGSQTSTLTISDLSLANATNYYVVATNVYGPATSSVATLTLLPLTGTLNGAANYLGNSIATAPMMNLTALGAMDWADWGDTNAAGPNNLVQKAGGTNQISDATAIGANSGPNFFDGTVVTTVWTDGSQIQTDTNNSGIYFNGIGEGCQISVPASTTKKVLTVFAGGYSTVVNVQAALSDNSAPPYVDASLSDPGGGSPGSAGAYVIEFASASANQTLTVNVTCGADFGYCNVTLMGATLAGLEPQVLVQPLPQTNDSGSSGQLIAEATGALPLSYRWYQGTPGSSVALTDGGQISGSLASTLTISNLTLANGGNYYVVITNDYGAVTSSVATLTVLGLTVTNPPVSQTNWVGQNAQFNVGAAGSSLVYQWYEGTPGSSVALSDGGQISGSSAPTLTIGNVTLSNGGANYYVVVSNNFAVVTSSVVTLDVFPITGTLDGELSVALVTNIDLTAEGTLDWNQWGTNDTEVLEQKAAGGNPVGLISSLTDINSSVAGAYGLSWDDGGDAPFTVSWTDGTPDAAGTNEANYVYIGGLGAGFQFTVPAGTTPEVLKVYYNTWNGQATIQASLSDNSAPFFLNNTLEDPDGNLAFGLATINFAAGSPGQTLTVNLSVTYQYQTGANVGLAAVTLAAASSAPETKLTWVGSNLQLTWPTGVLLQATNVTGPWTTNSATSPYTITPTGPQMFYRAVSADP